MNETTVDCPICHRKPGGWHEDECPRSRKTQRALVDKRKKARRGRSFWTKGPIAFRPAPGMDARLTYNPGIPYVAQGKHWRAGGVPRDTSAVDEFVKSIGGKT